jgi:hypothetical protein
MEKDFDADYWSKALGDANLDPTDEHPSLVATPPTMQPSHLGLVFGQQVVPIDTETVVRAAALIQDMIRRVMGDTVGVPVLAAEMIGRQEETARRLAALLTASQLDAVSYPDPREYDADLDAMCAFCANEVLPKLFTNSSDLLLNHIKGYAQVLIAGFKLGAFLTEHPLVG